MEGKQTALLRAFSSAASAKLRKNNKLIREMLKMERGRLQPQAQRDLGPWLIACRG